MTFSKRALSSGIGLAAVISRLHVFPRAHDVITTKVTWSREISRLIYKRCASCHHEGGSAFSLTTYEQARPWAKAIKEEVMNAACRPGARSKASASFRDDQGLTQEQIELITDWVEGGAPEGDPALLPKDVPEFKPHCASGRSRKLIVDGIVTLKAHVTAERDPSGQCPGRQIPAGDRGAPRWQHRTALVAV